MTTKNSCNGERDECDPSAEGVAEKPEGRAEAVGEIQEILNVRSDTPYSPNEDASLRYAGIFKREGEDIGLYDSVITRK